MPDPETITLRATVIGGIRYADDYQVIWRGIDTVSDDSPPPGLRASGAAYIRDWQQATSSLFKVVGTCQQVLRCQ